MSALTPKQQRFVQEYLCDLNATQAATRAGYSAKTARQAGAENLSKPVIRAAIEAARAAQSQRTEITADAVLTRLWSIANADPRELIEYRRTCCRWCYGKSFRYQHTSNELTRARANWEAAQKKNSPEVFDEQGGDGYNGTRDPNPDCPECFGEGHERIFVHDTRHISPVALMLYAGVKQTKDGLEVKMHDQMAALALVAKHVGVGEKPEVLDDDIARIQRLRDDLTAMDQATAA